eukprot:772074_1
MAHLSNVEPIKSCCNGKQLLKLTTADFETANPSIERLFRELTKLQLRAKKYKTHKNELIDDDLSEIKRRMQLFEDKWNAVLWIKNYTQLHNETPNQETIAFELGSSMVASSIYLEYYRDFEKHKNKDLAQLFTHYNIYKHCALWWQLIMDKFKHNPSPSLWLIFERIVLLSPYAISINLLHQYAKELSEFNIHKLDKVTQQIVIASKYPICTALELARFYKEKAQMDTIRGNTFEKVAEGYITRALHHLNAVKSDHLKSIILETKCDINDLSPFDMVLRYKLTSFVQDTKVERITSSIMNHWQFMKPENRDTSFKIDPLSVDSMWDKLWKSQTRSVFYLTPLGFYLTTIILYIAWLILFTVLSLQRFDIYDELSSMEILFWAINIGYIIHTVQCIHERGFELYYSIIKESYFDTVVSIALVLMICGRLFGMARDSPCNGDDECPTSSTEELFGTFWVIAMIAMYMRLILFCVLNDTLGLMIQTVWTIKHDVLAVLALFMLLMLIFMISLCMVHDDMERLDTMTMELNMTNIVIVAYIVTASIILLNAVITVLAKAFGTTRDANESKLIFWRFSIAMQYDQSTSFIPPPLNVIAIALLFVFYAIEYPIHWIRFIYYKATRQNMILFDLSLCMMPMWMKQRDLELDEQICYIDCGYTWHIDTCQGSTPCAMTDFNTLTMNHKVAFFRMSRTDLEKRKPLKVSILPHVKKQASWIVNLLQLNEKGLVDLSQFSVPVDSQWITKAYHDRSNISSPYYICAFCRRYVRTSNVSIIRLSKILRFDDDEMPSILNISPRICPHCFRPRTEISRYQLVGELISFWIFRLFVWWILVIIFAMIKVIRNPIQYIRTCVHYCIGGSNVTDTPHDAENSIDSLWLIDAIKQGMMESNIESELTEFQFVNDFVGVEELKETYGLDAWNTYFKPLSTHIFTNISNNASRKIPLHLLMKYPLNAAMCLDLMDQFWAKQRESKEEEKHSEEHQYGIKYLVNCTKHDIVTALDELKFLNCTNERERAYILSKIEQSKQYRIWDGIYAKFIQYLFDVESLFQDNHKINTLLRDIRVAMNDYGIDKKVNKDELQFLCKDINQVFVIPFMNTIQRDGNNLYLWDIWNNLMCLHYLKESAKCALNTKHLTTRMNEQEVKQMVLDMYGSDIIMDEKQNAWRDRMERSYSESSSTSRIHKPMSDVRDMLKLRDGKPKCGDSSLKKVSRTTSFYSSKITKNELMRNIEGIFEKIAQRTKISATAIHSYYAQDVIEREECLDYIYQQLCRFSFFYRDEVKHQCNVDNLVDILCNKLKFEDGHYIDEETIPPQIKDNHCQMIKKLYQHLWNVWSTSKCIKKQKRQTKIYRHRVSVQEYKSEEKEDVSSLHSKESLCITLHDILSIVSLYKRVHIKVKTQLMNITDLNCITHDIFVRFIDPEYEVQSCKASTLNQMNALKNEQELFGSTEHKIDISCADERVDGHESSRSKAASNLFHAMIHSQHNRSVSLGQIRESIHKCMRDIDLLDCGGITRVINHLLANVLEDNETSRQRSARLYEDNNFSFNFAYDVKYAKLQLKHLDRRKWSDFVQQLAQDCHFCNEECECKLCQNHFDHCASNMSVMMMNGNEMFGRQINRSTLRLEQERRDKVFDVMLSFCSENITLQQIFSFSVRFAHVLKHNDEITKLMVRYHQYRYDMKKFKPKLFQEDHQRRNEFWVRGLPETFDEFKQEFVWKDVWKSKQEKDETAKMLRDFKQELVWLHKHSKTIGELCYNINLFWSFKSNSNESKKSVPHGLMVLETYDFMKNAEKVTGSYTMMPSQFALLKHALGISDDCIHELFYIIRRKMRALSLQQMYKYFTFLLRMKYAVQNAILKSEQREDTMLTMDALKVELQIETEHESKWLFNKVCTEYQGKLTWKQIIEYLHKTFASTQS